MNESKRVGMAIASSSFKIDSSHVAQTRKDITNYQNQLNNVSMIVILLHSVPVIICRYKAIAIPTILFVFFVLNTY